MLKKNFLRMLMICLCFTSVISLTSMNHYDAKALDEGEYIYLVHSGGGNNKRRVEHHRNGKIVEKWSLCGNVDKDETGDGTLFRRISDIRIDDFKTHVLNGNENNYPKAKRLFYYLLTIDTDFIDEDGAYRYIQSEFRYQMGQLTKDYSISDKSIKERRDRLRSYINDASHDYEINQRLTMTIYAAKSTRVQDVITAKLKKAPKNYKVTFSKQDVNGKDLKGAVVQVLQNNTVVKTWNTGIEQVIELTPGDYIFKELSAPDGYLKAEDIVFKVSNDGKVIVENQIVDKVIMVDRYSKRNIKISKQNVDKEKLQGADLKILDHSQTNVLYEWTSTLEDKTIQLEPGKYFFKEEKAPEGYEVVNGFEFEVKVDGTIESSSTDIKTNGNQMIVYDQRKQVKKVTKSVKKIWHDNDENSRPKSVKVQLYADGIECGNEVELNGTNNWRYVWENLDDGKTYSVKEVDVPEGYQSTVSTINDGDTDYTITNTKLLNFAITETVTGNAGDKKKEFTFKVKLVDRSGNPISGKYSYRKVKEKNEQVKDYGEIIFIDGYSEIKLRHDQEIEIEGLVYDIRYTLTKADNDDHMTTYNGQENKIEESLQNVQRVDIVSRKENIADTGINGRNLGIEKAVFLVAGITVLSLFFFSRKKYEKN